MNEPRSIEERELQRVFDDTAAEPSREQLSRMLARAETIPGRSKRRRTGWLVSLLAAAALLVVIGGVTWSRVSPSSLQVATTAVKAPTVAPAVASVDEPVVDEGSPFLPTDPMAVLDDDWEGTNVWMGELDLLHGTGSNDEAFWEELELLMEEGG